MLGYVSLLSVLAVCRGMVLSEEGVVILLFEEYLGRSRGFIGIFLMLFFVLMSVGLF